VDEGPRYGVYFVPTPQSELYRFGSAVLGYDCYSGAALDFRRECKAAVSDWMAITDEPRRYGFHATLKAPFRLSPDCAEASLVGAVQNLARLGHAVPVIAPVIDIVSGFGAVVPSRPEPALDALANACTTILDAYRAPMSPQERARRLAQGLNAHQLENLDRWGYPFVFSEFRFRMTLTGRLKPDRQKATLALLRKCFERACSDRTVPVDRLALVKQDTAQTPFRVIHVAPLKTAA